MPSRLKARLGLTHHQKGRQAVRQAIRMAMQLPEPAKRTLQIDSASNAARTLQTASRGCKTSQKCRSTGECRNTTGPAPDCLWRSVMIGGCGCQPTSRTCADQSSRRPQRDATSRTDSHPPSGADLSSRKRVSGGGSTALASSAAAARRHTTVRPPGRRRQRSIRTLTGAVPAAGDAGS